jgi:hypothetical protein
MAELIPRPRTERRRSASSGLARVNNRIWMERTAAYASANVNARSPNASGTHSDTTSMAPIAEKIVMRVASCSGSITEVSHA